MKAGAGLTNTDSENPSTDTDISKIFRVMTIITVFMLLELWGHWHSNSLSLLADSVHLLVDILGFLVSLIALSWTKKKTNNKMTFGYHRYEVIGALISILFIWVATAYLILESIKRFLYPKKINEKSFVLVATVGFIVNLFCLHSLRHGHSDKHVSTNLNMKATYVHIIGDLIQSCGVLLASALTFFFPKIVFFDIACTFIFAFIVLVSTLLVVSEALSILVESAPKKIPMKNVRNDLLEFDKVLEVLDLKVWSVGVNKHACMTVLLCENILIFEYEMILTKIKDILNEKYRFSYLAVQIETKNMRAKYDAIV
ncbi:Cation Diffusion Facilitator (CDF) Family [Trachipleistophora hominis]|uniref:Cation Diffusion Facilitator (CDF) Family n=1 Tax=Trachipleistophora hominis TaxID=72359 RepID=L7JR72_TRAHO|nr:Cation Diffusion Facilitator (CDF) Family [Trachipleistophora hominis]